MTDPDSSRLLQEIRDLQQQQLQALQQLLQNQMDAIRVQQETARRARRLLPLLGIAIGIVLIIVLVLLRFVLTRYA